MVINYQGIEYKTKGIDLSTFSKEEIIDKYKKQVKVTGYYVLLLLYKELVVEKTKGGVLLPQAIQDKEDEYRNYAGLVLQIGPDAFKGDNFPSGAYVKEGDWVLFPRSALSLQLRYEDEPIVIIEDSKIKMIIDDPSKITK